MQGKRLPDGVWDATRPLLRSGEYFKDADGSWRACTPNGLQYWLVNHHVEEHEDGTISVAVSTGIGNKEWHGCIRHGVWEQNVTALHGEQAAEGLMHLLKPAAVLRDSDGREVDVVVYHDGQRYGGFRDEAHAGFMIRMMKWRDAVICYVPKEAQP